MPEVRDRMLQVWLPARPRAQAGAVLPPPGAPAPHDTVDPTPEPEPDRAAVPPDRAVPAPDPLDNRPWLKLVEDCVDLFDELDRQLQHLDPAGRELAEHVCLRLQEILQRCNVELIDQDGTFERTLHQAVGLSGAGIQVLSPGFRVGRRILRRARVQALPAGPTGTAGRSHDGDARG